jgi:hypothetical protein
MTTKLLKIQVVWEVTPRRTSGCIPPETQRHRPDDLSRKQHLSENLKPHNKVGAEWRVWMLN